MYFALISPKNAGFFMKIKGSWNYDNWLVGANGTLSQARNVEEKRMSFFQD
jgi:hypothetical protein